VDTLAILSIIFAVLGILGGLLPVLPGPPLSWVAILCLYFSSAPQEPVSKTALFVWLIIAAVLTIFDYILPGLMTKLTGGHKAAERGALIGLVVGLIFTPIGMILGSFIGAFVGEVLSQNKEGLPSDPGHALIAASGTFVAFILSTGLKVIFAGIVLWRVLADLF